MYQFCPLSLFIHLFSSEIDNSMKYLYIIQFIHYTLWKMPFFVNLHLIIIISVTFQFLIFSFILLDFNFNSNIFDF